jgi:hypothetical protein
LSDRVAIAPRLVVATFTVLLLAAWTVPLCCLSMSEPASAPHSTGETPVVSMQMSGHQHHHNLSGDSDTSSKRLTANESCAQNCRPSAANVAASLRARDGFAGFERTIATLTAPIQPILPSPRLLGIAPSSPPGIPLAFSDRAAPLRI